jgi:ribonuclease HI
MSVSAPHFLLFARATDNSSVFSGAAASANEAELGGTWRFVIQNDDGSTLLDVEDAEEGDSRERLELLAIVRGLEALDQPSQVTLVTQSRVISRGLSEGLAQWRDNDYQWERFGSLTPIKNRDLWRRIDQAIQIHQVKCRLAARGDALGDADDLSGVAAAINAQPTSTTREIRGRKWRFDPGEPTAAVATATSTKPARRRRGTPSPPASSLWQRAVSGVSGLFKR